MTDADLSNIVLQAARTAAESCLRSGDICSPWQHCSSHNQPLLPLLAALVDATAAVAGAVQDNCQADCLPLPITGAKALAETLYRVGDLITASAAPTTTATTLPAGWSLPSMTGRELV